MKKNLNFLLLILMLLCLMSCQKNKNIRDFYSIKQNDNYTYNYTVRDVRGKILGNETNLSRQPHLYEISESIVKASVQTGTGISTNIATYYDVYTGKVSETYQYVLGEFEENTVFAIRKEDGTQIVIQDIFDREKYHMGIEIEDVSDVIDPIVGFECTENGIKITYLSGEEYSETVKEIIIK